MRYLRIRRNQTRKDGSVYAVPLVIDKNRKYGNVTNEVPIKRKKCLLIAGAHDSGKTRWLTRLYDEWSGIWGSKSKSPPLWLGALRPLSSWAEQDHLAEWWDKKAAAAAEQGETVKAWRQLKAWQRADALPDYLTDTGAVLFVDDAHKLSGRKLQLARQCVMTARVWVLATAQENRIPPNLRAVALRRDPQVVRLGTDVAYDVTGIVMWAAIAAAALLGAYELAIVLGGLKLLGNGRRAARQE